MIKVTKNEAKMIKWIEEFNGNDWVTRSSLAYDKKASNGLIKKELVATHSTKGVTRKFHRTFNPAHYEII